LHGRCIISNNHIIYRPKYTFIKISHGIKVSRYIRPLKVALTIMPRNKILIIGDSHAKGCTAELSTLIGKTFDVWVL
jgi:hypothetical protein